MADGLTEGRLMKAEAGVEAAATTSDASEPFFCITFIIDTGFIYCTELSLQPSYQYSLQAASPASAL